MFESCAACMPFKRREVFQVIKFQSHFCDNVCLEVPDDNAALLTMLLRMKNPSCSDYERKRCIFHLSSITKV
jgi:hypothetical protein